MPATAGLNQAKTKNQELTPGLPCTCQRPNPWSHQRSLPGSALAESWSWDPSGDLNSCTPPWEADFPSGTLTFMPSVHPFYKGVGEKSNNYVLVLFSEPLPRVAQDVTGKNPYLPKGLRPSVGKQGRFQTHQVTALSLDMLAML